MTVKELIAKLQALPEEAQDASVCIDSETGPYLANEVEFEADGNYRHDALSEDLKGPVVVVY